MPYSPHFMERDIQARNYFHCTQSEELVKPEIRMTPRISGRTRPFSEPEIARVCVCRKISACLVSSVFEPEASIRVYQTLTRAWTPFRVADAHMTGERWILEPTDFKLIATLDDWWDDIVDNEHSHTEEDVYANMDKNWNFLRKVKELRRWRRFL